MYTMIQWVKAKEDENGTQSGVLIEGQGNVSIGPQNQEKAY